MMLKQLVSPYDRLGMRLLLDSSTKLLRLVLRKAYFAKMCYFNPAPLDARQPIVDVWVISSGIRMSLQSSIWNTCSLHSIWNTCSLHSIWNTRSLHLVHKTVVLHGLYYDPLLLKAF